VAVACLLARCDMDCSSCSGQGAAAAPCRMGTGSRSNNAWLCLFCFFTSVTDPTVEQGSDVCSRPAPCRVHWPVWQPRLTVGCNATHKMNGVFDISPSQVNQATNYSRQRAEIMMISHSVLPG
jgi:hypothetical protein